MNTKKTPETNTSVDTPVAKTETTQNKPSLPAEKKAPVTKETEKNLSENPENLFPKNSLDKAGVSVGEAKETTRKILGIDEIELPGTKDAIKEFQRKNKLTPVDGIVGKNTIRKMNEILAVSNSLINIATKELKTPQGLSYNTLLKISNILPRMMYKSINYKALVAYVARFKECNKYSNNKKTNFQKLIRRIDGDNAETKKKIEESEAGQSFYKTWKDIQDGKKTMTEGAMEIISDPDVLLAGGLLFLFGVIGGDSKYTNSFWKRLGWIFGGMLLGPQLCDKIGCKEMLDDFDKSAQSGAIDDAQGAAVETSKEVASWIGNTASSAWGWITKKFGGAKDAIGGLEKSDFKLSFGTLAGKLETANKAQEIDKIIPEKNFQNLTKAILGDPKFGSLRKDQLANIDKSNINSYLSKENNKKLKAEDLKYVENYISLIKAKFQAGDKRVRDLYLTTSMIDQMKGAFAKVDSSYTDISEIDNNINGFIKDLIGSPKKEKRIAAIDFAVALKAGDLSQFELDNYDIDKALKAKFNEKIAIYTEYKNIYKPALEELETINASDDGKMSIKDDYNKLIELHKKKDSLKIQKLKDNFELKWKKKEIEIFEKAKELKIPELNGKNVSTYLGSIKKIEEKINIIYKLREFKKIKTIPSLNDSINEFKSWYEKYEQIFEEAKKYENDTDTDISNLSKEILQKKDDFIKNYEKVKNKYGDKLTKLNTKLTNIDSKTKINDKLKAINEIKDGYSNLLQELSPDLVGTFKEYYKKISSKVIGKFVIPQEKNPIAYLDDKLNLPNKIDFQSFSVDIELKIINIESTYNVSLNSGSEVKDAKKHFSIITQFEEAIKEGKLTELKENIKNDILQGYLDEIKVVSDLEVLSGIYTKYQKVIEKKLHSDILDDSVEEAYKEKQADIIKNKIVLKSLKEIRENKDIKKLLAPFIKLAESYKDYKNSSFGTDILLVLNKSTNVKLLLFVNQIEAITGYSDSKIMTDYNLKKNDIKSFKEDVKTAIDEYKSLLNNDSNLVKLLYIFN